MTKTSLSLSLSLFLSLSCAVETNTQMDNFVEKRRGRNVFLAELSTMTKARRGGSSVAVNPSKWSVRNWFSNDRAPALFKEKRHVGRSEIFVRKKKENCEIITY